MNIFDKIHKENFDRLFGLDGRAKEDLRKLLKASGMSDEEIEEALVRHSQIHEGEVFGHAHEVDIEEIIQRALFAQGAKAVTLKISHDAFDEASIDGHLNIEVLKVEGWK